MYGLSDHLNGIPRTWLSADLQGSSRYSARILPSIEHMFDRRPESGLVTRF